MNVNGRRFWRENEIMGLQMTLGPLSQCGDVEEYLRMVRDRDRLAQLVARKASVKARYLRVRAGGARGRFSGDGFVVGAVMECPQERAAPRESAITTSTF